MNIQNGNVIKTWDLPGLLKNQHLLDCDGERTFVADIEKGVIGSVPEGLVDYLIDLKSMQGKSGFRTQMEYMETSNPKVKTSDYASDYDISQYDQDVSKYKLPEGTPTGKKIIQKPFQKPSQNYPQNTVQKPPQNRPSKTSQNSFQKPVHNPVLKPPKSQVSSEPRQANSNNEGWNLPSITSPTENCLTE